MTWVMPIVDAVHQAKNILRAVPIAVRPVFQVGIDPQALRQGIGHRLLDIGACCSSVLRSWSRQCFSLPLVSRLMTLPPVDDPVDAAGWSTKPSTSTRSETFLLRPTVDQATASFSPLDTQADATSIRSTRSDFSKAWAMFTFSSGVNETPWVCSPSRRVVSMSWMCLECVGIPVRYNRCGL